MKKIVFCRGPIDDAFMWEGSSLDNISFAKASDFLSLRYLSLAWAYKV